MTNKEYNKKWRENNSDKVREYSRKFRIKNPDYQKKYRKTLSGKEARKREIEKDKPNRLARWKEYKPFLFKLRLEKGGKCSICGYCKQIRILQFHHLRDKSFGVCDYRGKMSERIAKRIRVEADKCILLCPNCHGEITIKEIDAKYNSNIDTA